MHDTAVTHQTSTTQLTCLSGTKVQILTQLCGCGWSGAASFMITLSPDINGVIFGRFLGGVFAASVPVAQAKKKKSVMGLYCLFRACLCTHLHT